MKTEAINKMAMDLVGELQSVPAQQAYDTVKRYLDESWKRGADEKPEPEPEAENLEARIALLEHNVRSLMPLLYIHAASRPLPLGKTAREPLPGMG